MVSEERLRLIHHDLSHRWKELTHAQGEQDMQPRMVATLGCRCAYSGSPSEWTGAIIGDGTDGPSLMDVMGFSVRDLWAKHEHPSPIRSVILILEAYMADAVTKDQLPKPGDLGRDFKSNPDTKVLEMVATTVIEHNPKGGAAISTLNEPFHRTDGGVLVWHEPTLQLWDETNPVQGRVHAVFDRVFRDCKEAPNAQ